VLDDAILFIERQRIAKLALRNRLPLVSGISGYAEAGALMTYGARQTDLYHRAAIIVDRILKGAKPANLPIEQPGRFELVLNSEPQRPSASRFRSPLLLRADRLIE